MTTPKQPTETITGDEVTPPATPADAQGSVGSEGGASVIGSPSRVARDAENTNESAPDDPLEDLTDHPGDAA